ncbi:hypothetical protein HYW17_04100 [Candidatus Uhrbacteria bacterium]|nr:hypothetical protein [Candidatus Uhrbacteria bacterium]
MDSTPWDWTASDEALAARLVAEPLGADFFMGHPVGDLLSGRNGAPQDPARYAHLFELASNRTTDPAMRLACRVEEWNGRRRPPNAADHNTVATAYARIRDDLIQDLPSGQFKYLLGASVCYNLGIVLRGLRHYREAGNSQLASANYFMAAGRQEKAPVGLFLVAVEYTSDSITRDSSPEIAVQLAHLRQMRELVRATTEKYPLWMQENATWHIWFAHLLAERDYLEREDDRNELRSGTFPTAYASWKRLFQVSEIADPETQIAAADAALVAPEVTLTSFANVVLSLKLHKARALKSLGRTDEARAVLTEVTSWTGVDGGVPMAVAARLLQTL